MKGKALADHVHVVQFLRASLDNNICIFVLFQLPTAILDHRIHNVVLMLLTTRIYIRVNNGGSVLPVHQLYLLLAITT